MSEQIFTETFIRSGQGHIPGIEMEFVLLADHVKLEQKLTAIEKKVDELIEKYKEIEDDFYKDARETDFIEDLKQIKELL